jgi:hypothetical protein
MLPIAPVEEKTDYTEALAMRSHRHNVPPIRVKTYLSSTSSLVTHRLYSRLTRLMDAVRELGVLHSRISAFIHSLCRDVAVDDVGLVAV